MIKLAMADSRRFQNDKQQWSSDYAEVSKSSYNLRRFRTKAL